jgi:diguanylate cyclase (GGDEF)-like protein
MSQEVEHLRSRLEREQRARVESESIAERATAELHRRQQELFLLSRIAATANELQGADEVLRVALELVCRHTGWPVGHVFFRSGPELMEPSNLWFCDDAEAVSVFRQATRSLKLRPNEGLPGKVLATGKPEWVESFLEAEGTYPRATDAMALGMDAAIAFPILVGSELVAVAEFFAPEVKPPDDALLFLLHQLGTQLGRVIERARAAEKLRHDALHDALTGLPNRTLLVDRLDQMLKRTSRASTLRFAVFFLDLDRFKLVNDSVGHLVGDALLQAVAQRLRNSIRGADTLARLGGDEFALLMEFTGDDRAVLSTSERIHDQLSSAFIIEGHELFVTASIGISIHDAHRHRGPEDLLREADTAMYRAKSRGRSSHELFDVAMHQRAVNTMKLESELRRAIERKELCVYYQPVVSLSSHQIVGLEALMRWRHPTRGLVPPSEFIPIAEDTGLICSMGDWVVKEACQKLKRWEKVRPGLTVGVNVSSRQFAQNNLVERIADTLAETKLPHSQLKLELTESAVMENADRATSMFARLKELGVTLALDDFGTGYASLSYLHRFSMDTLKIDGTFVRGMNSDPKKVEIVRTIVLLARSFRMNVTAECIETADELQLISSLGCDEAQGYYFARPLPESEVEALLLNPAPWTPSAPSK